MAVQNGDVRRQNNCIIMNKCSYWIFVAVIVSNRFAKVSSVFQFQVYFKGFKWFRRFQVYFKGSKWFSMDPSVSCIREVNMQQSILVAEVVLLLLSIIVLFFVVDEYQTCNESTVLPLRNTNMKPYMLQATSIPTNYKYW